MELDRLVIGYDHHAKEFAVDPWGVHRPLRERCPVAWSEAYGGFWVLSGYEEIASAARDDATFSSYHAVPNDGHSYTGIGVPEASPIQLVPIEMDPPEFLPYRRVLNPAFAPASIDRLVPQIRAHTTRCLDERIEAGTIDFVADLASPVPAMATMDFMGLPLDGWERWARCFHAQSYTPLDSPQRPAVDDDIQWVTFALGEAVEEQRQRTRPGLISALLEARIDGEPISHERLVQICFLVLGAGVDTTTGLLAYAFDHLDSAPLDRARLMRDSAAIPTACEEMLRHHSPGPMDFRTATHDVELGGQLIRKDERVQLCWLAANHDPAVFPDADSVIIDRFPNRHTAFGLGLHRCLGSTFARRIFAVVVEEVLRRMPDYSLEREGVSTYEDAAMIRGYVTMPARFTSGRRLATAS